MLAVSRRWPEPERDFRAWHRGRAGNDVGPRRGPRRAGPTRHLGGEHGRPTRHQDRQFGPPIRYDTLGRCLTAVGEHALTLHASIHIPRIGCGLAGGRWDQIEPIIIRTLCARDIPTVDDF